MEILGIGACTMEFCFFEEMRKSGCFCRTGTTEWMEPVDETLLLWYVVIREGREKKVVFDDRVLAGRE